MHNSKASLYLMELMISVLFFSISSAVCVQLFVKAHLVNKETDIRTHAVLAVQNTAEYFLISGGDKEKTLSYYADYSENSNQVTVYFDNTFMPCREDAASYIEHITFTQDDTFSYANIEMRDTKGTNTYYELDIKKYRPGGFDTNEEK